MISQQPSVFIVCAYVSVHRLELYRSGGGMDRCVPNSDTGQNRSPHRASVRGYLAPARSRIIVNVYQQFPCKATVHFKSVNVCYVVKDYVFDWGPLTHSPPTEDIPVCVRTKNDAQLCPLAWTSPSGYKP